MRNLFFPFLFFFCGVAWAQHDNDRFCEFEISLPLRINPEKKQNDDNPFLVVDGLTANAGYGFHFEESYGISLNAGIDWHITGDYVATPVFLNANISPQITEKYKLVLQYGYGHTWRYGYDKDSGWYQRFNIGLKTENGFAFFADLSVSRLRDIDGSGHCARLGFGVGYWMF